MPPSIQIPKFEGNATIPPNAIEAPDAPMVDSAPPPASNSSTPPPADNTQNFLAAVKNRNNQRQEQKDVVLDSSKPKEKPVEKRDTTPDVFKKAAGELPDAKPDTGDDASSEGDESSVEGEDFVDPLDAEIVGEKPAKAKNMKELKSHLKTARAREAQLRKNLEEKDAEVQRLAAFQDKIEEHEQMKERIAQLETYEKIFDIHNNPEFQEKYVAGAQNLVNQAKEIATQYGVKDTSIIDHAVKLRNRKELTDFLKRQGLDDYGISDLRPYIFQLQSLETERITLEKSPEQAREALSKMFKESESRRVKEVSKTIHERATNSWNQIVGHYSRGETSLEILKEKPGDPEHTDRRNTVLARSNDEYVKVMGAFVGLGIKDMPAPIAHVLAARFQLSEIAGELNAENRMQKKKIAELEAELKEKNGYMRPSFNGTSRNGPTNGSEAPKGTDIASHVFNKARDVVNNRPAR